MNVIDVYEINFIRTAEMKSNEEWSSQLWTQFMQLRKKSSEVNKIENFFLWNVPQWKNAIHNSLRDQRFRGASY